MRCATVWFGRLLQNYLSMLLNTMSADLGLEDPIGRMLKKAVQQGRSEVRDAMNKERQVCTRLRDGEPAASRAEASRS